ncbi:MAG TPA: PAS domain S-box protein, partial [Planctomycetota bacterium]|nr:PAS domain S-box protein [Planctomycetota bacterium]
MASLLLKNADGWDLPARNADVREIRPDSERRPPRVPPDELARRRAAAARLVDLARPHLEWMADMLSDLTPVVYLVDADGVVLLSAAASGDLLRGAEAEPGCAWSEAVVGTNAAGSALAAGTPILAVGTSPPEPSWRAFTALAAPVRTPDGRPAGALVASAPQASARPERLAVAAYAAFAVEHQWTAQERRSAPSADLAAAADDDGRIRRLLDAAPDALVVTRSDGTIVFANTQVEALFGYSKEEVIGRPVEFLVPERLRALCESHRDDSLRSSRPREGGQGFDLVARRKNGREIPVEISLSPIRAREGLLVAAAIRDISERRQADRRLEIRDAVSRALAESATFAEAAPRILQAVVEGL